MVNIFPLIVLAAASGVAYNRNALQSIKLISAYEPELGRYENREEHNGQSFEFLERGYENGGAKLVFIETCRKENPISFYPGRDCSPPYHVHTAQKETFQVLEGTMTYMIDGKTGELQENETATVLVGQHHNFWNNGTGTLKMKITLEPALTSEAFIENLASLQRQNLLNTFQAFTLFFDHYLEFGSDVPRPVHWMMKHMGAPLGKLLGFKSLYLEYTSEESMRSLKHVHKYDPSYTL